MEKQYAFQETIRRVEHCDVCVIGGSATGVFAAVRAARLGARVVLIEQNGMLGGVATAGLVGIWHPLYDIGNTRQIIGGLTFEILERLEMRRAVTDFRTPSQAHIRFHSDELCLELDALLAEHPAIHAHLHSTYLAPVRAADGERIEAVIAADINGRFAVAADVFIDASGDGLLCRDAGVAMWKSPSPQPPTSCCRFENWPKFGNSEFKDLIERHRDEDPDLPCGYYWGMGVPNSGLFMFAGTRVQGVDCSDAADLTAAEFAARRQIRAVTKLLQRELPDAKIALAALPAMIGIREGLHISSRGQLSGAQLLKGEESPDTIAHGTYPVDIHHNGSDRIEFFRLTGEHVVKEADRTVLTERWLPEGEWLPCYHIPLSCLIPAGTANLIAAGRMLDADRTAFGAARVMVNLNQCGEAAGVAAALSLAHGGNIDAVSPEAVRASLNAGGSLL